MKDVKEFEKVRDELNEVSPSFCLAKWLQVTIHLQNGMTHSCHHPPVHKIPLDEIEKNPSALHNTIHKKEQRKKMLTGKRPAECDYCWNIEDSNDKDFSDRTYKSADQWAAPHFNDVKKMPWDINVQPTYVEVSFGNECNFKCAYCSPVVSSGILAEYHKHGHYKVQSYSSLANIKATNQYPYSKDEHNPYVEAFWKWWPELSKNLEVFRITGGEPLLNPSTSRFLEHIIQNPLPKLDVAINSNLSVPDIHLQRFLNLSKQVVTNKVVKNFEIYTSVDTFEEQAEYIRNGLNFKKFISNLELVLDTLPGIKIVIMCTFNALSVPRFEDFLKLLKDLKLKYMMSAHHSRIELNISYLRHPEFMAANILPPEFRTYVEKALDYMLRNSFVEGDQIFSEIEIGHLRRILEWMKHDHTSPEKLTELRDSFYFYFSEYDVRKGTNFRKTFPEMESFFNSIEARLTE